MTGRVRNDKGEWPSTWCKAAISLTSPYPQCIA